MVNKGCVLNRGLAVTTVYIVSAIDNISMGGVRMKFNLGICLDGIHQ